MTRIQKNIFNSMYNFILPSINLWLFADVITTEKCYFVDLIIRVLSTFV